jgi:hypothetical protein
MLRSEDRRLDKFYSTQLLRVSQQYRREGRQVLAGNPDPQLPSYYVQRSQTTMTKKDFETGSCRDTDELAEALREMWGDQGFEELAELAPQLAKLAARLKGSQHESEDVSPFVYVMY